MMPSTEGQRLVLTGMLGDVMRESAQAAVSYVWSNAESLDIDTKLFERKTVHVHVPAGAVPKDGPSAGVTIDGTALASLATRRPVQSKVAMTAKSRCGARCFRSEGSGRRSWRRIGQVSAR